MGFCIKELPVLKCSFIEVAFDCFGETLGATCENTHKHPEAFDAHKSSMIHFWDILNHLWGHHAPHGMHSSKMHSSIQHPNMYCSTIIQHNQSNTPVIMHPKNVFIL